MLVTVSLSYNAHSSGNRHDPSWTSVKAESLCSDHRAAVEDGNLHENWIINNKND